MPALPLLRGVGNSAVLQKMEIPRQRDLWQVDEERSTPIESLRGIEMKISDDSHGSRSNQEV